VPHKRHASTRESSLGGDSRVRLTPEPGEAEPLQNGTSKPADSPRRDGHHEGDGTPLNVKSLAGHVSALRMADGHVDASAAASG